MSTVIVSRVSRMANGLVELLARRGVGLRGARVLRIRGRTTGEWRTTPVNPLVVDGRRYLVAPRGVTDWVRNLRQAGYGELQLGRRVEPFTATELTDQDKPPILRSYLKHWWFEVGTFFPGTRPDATDDELGRIAPGYPVFRID